MGFGNRPNGGGNNGFGRRGSAVKYPQLDREAISNFIDQFSSSIKYWKAMQCPCMTPETGQPNISCAQCRGVGYFYTDYQKEDIFQKAQVHSRRSSKKNDAGGTVTTGYSSITFLPGVIPGEGDLVQVCQDKEVVNDEYHVVGSKLTDGTTAESFRFRDIVCVESVAIQMANKSIQIADPSTWEFDSQQRKINWKNKLPAGSKYSVRYIAVPEYMVRAESAKPLLRVTHDDNLNEPYRYTQDIVYPFNVEAVRLDRAIIQRQRGAVDLTVPSTFNNSKGKGPFR